MLSLPPSISYQQQKDKVDTLLIDNQFAKAEIALFGAHMLSFKPKTDQRERLFVSKSAILNGDKAIRGGIPVCWPWFGGLNEGYQMHGYARDRVWDLVSAKDSENGTELVFSLADTKGDGFSGDAELALTVLVAESLTLSLQTKNTGNEAFELSTALHTYFAVADINDVELIGLSGVYSDKVNNWEIGTTPSPYRFPEHTDRIHFDPAEELTIIENDKKTNLKSAGHDSIVVWNPGADLSKSMSDMADDSYLTMLCVETAVTQGKKLAAKEVHTLEMTIK